MTDWDALVKHFFSLSPSEKHSFRCKFHYGAHWQDSVSGGVWLYHNHLIARYDPPFLYITDAGYPTYTTRARLQMLLSATGHRIFVHSTRLDEWGDRVLVLEKGSRVYVLERGKFLAINVNSGEVYASADGRVLSEPKEVLVDGYSRNEIVGRIILRGFGVLYFTKDGMYLKRVKERVAVKVSPRELADIISDAEREGKLTRRLAALRSAMLITMMHERDLDGAALYDYVVKVLS